MTEIISVVLAIAISLCWYLPCVKAQGNARVLHRNDYLKAFFLFGILFTCILIIVTEITWDRLSELTPLSGLTKDIVSDFFRAALLEELFKFLGFRLAKKNLSLHRKTDCILIAGLIGVSYSMVEKAVNGNIIGVIIGLAIPMHIMWQFNQGGHYFEYEKLKAAGDITKARKELFLAIFVPFLFHGCWDSGLDIVLFCINTENDIYSFIGMILLLAMVAAGIIYTIRTIIKVFRTAKNDPAEVPCMDQGSVDANTEPH
ncbi:MAG: PrsW family intramembrane metalloprotease [Ruminiclostridium sp.]|nr:PrsW family intramembrane metalloprotease [Ruminiclostridium sp.]